MVLMCARVCDTEKQNQGPVLGKRCPTAPGPQPTKGAKPGTRSCPSPVPGACPPPQATTHLGTLWLPRSSSRTSRASLLGHRGLLLLPHFRRGCCCCLFEEAEGNPDGSKGEIRATVQFSNTHSRLPEDSLVSAPPLTVLGPISVLLYLRQSETCSCYISRVTPHSSGYSI